MRAVLQQHQPSVDFSSLVRITKSQIETFIICSMKFWFQYVLGAAPEFTPGSLAFGRTMHSVVAAFYREILEGNPRPSLKWLEDLWVLQWMYDSQDPTIRYSRRETTAASLQERGRGMLQSFYRHIQPWTIEGIEYEFAVPVLVDPKTKETLVHLAGKVDLIESNGRGALVLSELKTSSSRYSDRQAEDKLDGQLYAFALKAMGYDVAMVRYDVMVKTQKPSFQQVFVSPTPEDDRSIVYLMKRMLRAIEKEAYVPHVGWACATCPFQKRCEKERTS